MALQREEFDYIAALWHSPQVEVVVHNGCASVCNSLFVERLDRSRERETQIMREETAVECAPLWVSVPVQILACLVYLLFILTMSAGFLIFGSGYIIGQGICAIARGLRWALC